MLSRKIIKISPHNIPLQDILIQELRISRSVAQILINRGITTVKEADRFLNVDISHLLDPFTFPDMKKAVGIVEDTIRKKDPVMIFSDYDVDGVTSLTLLKHTLAGMGGEPFHYIPNRIKEGYGLNTNVLRLVREKNIKLLITADCGTNSFELLDELRRLGIKIIITDHHEPVESPHGHGADAVINPKLKDSSYGYRELAGVGVAYKFCQALTGKMMEDYLDLVVLGTVADAVPLTGENRVIVKEGMASLSNTNRIGLRALIEASRIKNKKFTPEFISFILGPRINASGRMDSAETALDLLMSRHEDHARELAKTIEGYNRQRQRVESAMLEEAKSLIDREVNFKEHKVMVVAKEGWHPGVLGIVAAKLADKFYRPTILISLTDDLCRGSGRSVKNFHLFEGVVECSDLLTSVGGHQHAIGMVISKDKIEDFRDRINACAREKLLLEDLIPSLDIDAELSLSDVTEKLAWEIKKLEPFGSGNPEPLFLTRSLRLKGEPRILSRDTLKMWVTDGVCTYPSIGFGMGSLKESLMNTDIFDMVYSVKIDDWQGEFSLILEMKEAFIR